MHKLLGVAGVALVKVSSGAADGEVDAAAVGALGLLRGSKRRCCQVESLLGFLGLLKSELRVNQQNMCANSMGDINFALRSTTESTVN